MSWFERKREGNRKLPRAVKQGLRRLGETWSRSQSRVAETPEKFG